MTVYDEFADRTNWGPGHKLQVWLNARYLEILKSKIDNFEALTNILEIGAGRGDFATAVQKNSNLNYVGVEPNSALKSIAENSNPNTVFFQYALPHVSQFLSKSQDAVILIHALEHAGNGYEARNWIEDARNCVRPGGYVVIVSPEILSFREYFWDIDWSHCFPTSLRNIIQLGADLSMNKIYSGYMNLGGISHSRRVLAKCIGSCTPTKLMDWIFFPFLRRKVASGLKVSLLWDVCVVIFQVPEV